MSDRRRAIGLIFFGVLLLEGCAITTVREHPTLEDQLERIDRVVIAPPVVNVNLITFDGDNRRLSEEERRIEDELMGVAERELTEHGFDVIDFDFYQAIENDDEFAFAVEQVMEGYRQARKTLYKSLTVGENDKRKFKASVGEVVNMIADKTGADAVLLMEYDGFKKSQGKIAQEMAASVLFSVLTGQVETPMSTGSAVEVVLVDAWTGEVLWTNVQGGAHLNAQPADLAMDKFPDDVDPEEAKSPSDEPVTPESESDNLSGSDKQRVPLGFVD